MGQLAADTGFQRQAIVLTDRRQGLVSVVTALRQAGFDTIHEFANADEWPDFTHGGIDLLLHDGTEADDQQLHTDIARLLIATGSGRQPALYSLVRSDQLELAVARLLGTAATILCDPQPHELEFAFAEAVSSPSNLVNDAGTDEQARLQRMNEEVARVAVQLLQLSREANEQTSAPSQVGVTAEELRRVIRARRLREEFFKGGLLSDPAWDMLLDLLASQLEGKSVSITSLCIASNAPPTTALRWLGVLEGAGLVERYPDPVDRRRSFVQLSVKGRQSMAQFLSSAVRAGLPLV